MDEYLTVAQLRHLLAAFPDDAYVSLVSQFGDTGMLTVDSVVSVTDGSSAQDMSHVYLYGETTTPILEEANQSAPLDIRAQRWAIYETWPAPKRDSRDESELHNWINHGDYSNVFEPWHSIIVAWEKSNG